MHGRHDQAELLAALWTLGDGPRHLPLSGGVLDLALLQAVGDLPPQLSELTFSTTRVGLRCLDLPEILRAAEEAELFETDGSSQARACVLLDEDAARTISVAAGISTADARRMGTGLKARACAPA